MRIFWVGAVACFATSHAFAEPKLRGLPFNPDKIPITWSAPRTNLPAALWVYKNIPQTFPPVAISNLMELGAFTMKDKTVLKGDPLFRDKNVLYFQDKQETHHLGIFPAQGWIEYADSRARAGMKDKVEGVPDEETALEMALEYLKKCGIDSSQLATKPPCNELLIYKNLRRRGRFDKEQGTNVVEIESRGVFFVRRIDRISFVGIGNGGGFTVVFGNHGKVVELQILWRNLEPYKLLDLPTSEKITEWLRAGKGLITDMQPPKIDWGQVRRLNITKLTPYYLGSGGEEPQQFVIPFADLEINAELDTTNISFGISCPIESNLRAK